MMTTLKLDMAKEYKSYYTAKTTPELFEFEGVPLLMVSGKGEPRGDEFSGKLEALYSLAYGVKNICKKQARDFTVPKLEGLWWVESDMPALEVPREEWMWTLLIRMPDFVSSDIVKMAEEEVFKKKGIQLIKEIQLGTLDEGKCVQALHVGPYSTEPETIAKMKAFMHQNDLLENGPHHEIYLSDPRKVAPEKLKTILRQPVKKR